MNSVCSLKWYIVGLLGMVSSVLAEPNQCSSQAVIEKMQQRLDAITVYQFNATSTLNDDTLATMTMYGKRPNLLKAIINTDKNQPVTVVFDGKHEWINDGEAFYFIDLTRIPMNRDRPFDSPYALSGNGLLSGEDYVGTIKTLLSVYDFNIAKCSSNNIQLLGTLNRIRFAEYTKVRAITSPIDSFVQEFAKVFGQLTLNVDKNTYLVNSYLLTGGDKSEKFLATFDDYQFNDIPEAEFNMLIPQDIRVMDITPTIEDDEQVKVL